MNPITTMPKDGKQYLVWDEELGVYDVANQPKGYALGKWFKTRGKNSWGGAAFPGYFKATHWMKLPKRSKKERRIAT